MVLFSSLNLETCGVSCHIVRSFIKALPPVLAWILRTVHTLHLFPFLAKYFFFVDYFPAAIFLPLCQR